MFYKLASSIGRLQTLEPTQVSGFNQFFEDVGGTRSWNYGVGVDQSFASIVFFGASWLRRDRTIPEADCPAPNPFSGCSGVAGTVVNDKTSKDDIASAYVNVLIGKRVAASVDWDFDKRLFDTTTMSPLFLFQDRFETQRIRPQFRFFLPIGFYASVRGTHYDQEVDQFDDLTSTARTTINSSFWIIDAAVGWRLPKRLGSVSIEGTNLGDKQFDFYEQSLQENLIPARRVWLRADFAF